MGDGSFSCQARLREMFDRVVLRKDASLIPVFYDTGFRLYSNDQEQDYQAFLEGHERLYATDISYAASYDEDAWVESEDEVAGRMWITTTKPGQPSTRIEVILVARFCDGRLHRLWELTWPDWSNLPAVARYQPEQTPE